MSLFRKAVFHTTVANLHDLPGDSICEVAFAGRSNAGKSSAINALANHTRLAFVSKTPGRTQHLNYFTLDAGKYFVDLPGYGFAKAPEEIRAQWEGLLAPYLWYRLPLAGLVLIMDCRHPLTDLDLQMLEWFAQTGKPIHVLLSKSDKLTRQEQANVLREVGDALSKISERCTLQLFSSLKRTGIEEAERVLATWLDMPLKAEVVPPTGLRTEKVARAKNRKAIGWSARSADKKADNKKPPAKG
ncbi:ribosome biogenesis GTP-binding protein YihA/YsxC [uncultured Propionivibrio sp.]|uniref:ribosome biogenesis GTP-binding protein YihA/YsxC n=1 Tax=uncultured Propionivibrio sp. TaxID=426737 RepID=UPI0029BFD192|nr:ribosome biogenesis GTP-binding protein YihA/YsxC [uncultured Propionivibrio sp.]